MNRITTYIFWVLIIAGFIIRFLSLSYNGIFDIATYNEWGINTLRNGLHSSYIGTYFPFQYQIFELGSWISTVLNIDYFIVFKSINLLFDCGNLIILYLILKQFNVSKLYLLLYWLHPWFLNVFSLGYCDFHFTFFILCALYFTFKATSGNYLIAGVFLGFAFLMKPQVQIIFLSFFIYSLIIFFKKKDISIIYIFLFSAIFFLAYNLYFVIKSGNPLWLAATYLDVANNMSCLNANFLNGWFSVAYILKGPEDLIYAVSDKLTFVGIYWRHIAIALVLGIILIYLLLLNKKALKDQPASNLFFIACFSSIIVPFIMTSAHENHFFLPSVLLIPILGATKNIIFKISIHILLLLQFINMYGYYGIGDTGKIRLININYTYEKAFILSLIAFCMFLVVLYFFLSRRSDLYSQFLKQPVVKNE